MENKKNSTKKWLILAGVVVLALVFLLFSEKKQTTEPDVSSPTVTAQQEIKEIIAELGYGDDETFPEVVFLDKEKWMGGDRREVKKLLIEHKVVPEHDYYNVFNEETRNGPTRNDVGLVKVEFSEGNIRKETGKPSILVEVYTSEGSRGGYTASISNELEYIEQYIITQLPIPSCYGGCNLSERYLEKYPEMRAIMEDENRIFQGIVEDAKQNPRE